MDPKRLSSKEYWSALYEEKASGRSPASGAHRFKNWVPAGLRQLRNNLLREHWFRQLVTVLLRPHLEGRPGLKGLEVGSAPGYRSLELWQRFGIEPHGLEYTEDGAALQRGLYRTRGLSEELVVCGDFFNDALRAGWAGKFDLVTSYGFIEHFDYPKDVVAKHLELLRPGGLLVVTVPNINEGTWYGRLVRRFNPKVYAMHNIRTCTRDQFCKIFDDMDCDVLYCGTLGGCDISFLPDGRRASRAVAFSLRLVNPVLNVLNHLWVGNRLREFPRTSSTLAAVAVKR